MESSEHRTWRDFRAAGLALLFVILALPLEGQNQSLQSWPEVDAYWTLNSSLRVSFFSAATWEDLQGTSGEIGPNIDFFLKPIIKLKKIAVFQLDKSKERPLMLRSAYRYMPSKNGPAEHRVMIEATGRYPLVRGALVSDRNRIDLRSIGGDLSWRYRNRLSAERTVAVHGYHFTPYIRLEGYYDSRYQKWNRTTETVGIVFPIRKHYEIESYYEHQNDTSTSPNRQVDGLGYVLSVYF